MPSVSVSLCSPPRASYPLSNLWVRLVPWRSKEQKEQERERGRERDRGKDNGCEKRCTERRGGGADEGREQREAGHRQRPAGGGREAARCRSLALAIRLRGVF